MVSLGKMGRWLTVAVALAGCGGEPFGGTVAALGSGDGQADALLAEMADATPREAEAAIESGADAYDAPEASEADGDAGSGDVVDLCATARGCECLGICHGNCTGTCGGFMNVSACALHCDGTCRGTCD